MEWLCERETLSNVYKSIKKYACLSDKYSSLQSLRGPRGGMIFFKREPVLGVDLESAVNNAVFPGLQVGGILSICLSSGMYIRH